MYAMSLGYHRANRRHYCVCIFYIVMLEPLLMSTLYVSFFVVVKLLVAFSISMYIMCVILCLFGALNRKVGALQMSIFIVIN